MGHFPKQTVSLPGGIVFMGIPSWFINQRSHHWVPHPVGYHGAHGHPKTMP